MAHLALLENVIIQNEMDYLQTKIKIKKEVINLRMQC